jgi:hypothetical protein
LKFADILNDSGARILLIHKENKKKNKQDRYKNAQTTNKYKNTIAILYFARNISFIFSFLYRWQFHPALAAS